MARTAHARRGRLEGRRVVIIGGTSGIGLATARLAMDEGASVVVASRTPARLKQAARALGPDAQCLKLDGKRESDVKAFFERVGRFDDLAILIPGATDKAQQRRLGALAKTDMAVARTVHEGKFWSSVYCAKHALPHLSARGSITFCSGVSPRKAIPGYWAPTTAIAALEALSRVLAVELAPIRVNCVGPGLIATPIMDTLSPARRRVWAKMLKRQPIKRMGTPEETAEAMVYCMSNGYTTGTLVEIDGGYKFT